MELQRLEEIVMGRNCFNVKEGVRFVDMFLCNTKAENLEYARQYGIRIPSSLKAREVAERLADSMKDTSNIQRLMSTLTDEQIYLFEQAVKVQKKEPKGLEMRFGEDRIDDAVTLMDYHLATLHRDKKMTGKTGDFCERLMIPVDLIEIYENRVNNPVFHRMRKRRVWLCDLMEVVPVIYGAIPVDKFLEIYNGRKGFRLTREEMKKQLAELPPEADLICEVIGEMVVSFDMMDEPELFEDMLEEAEGKPWYIPYWEEVVDISRNGYPSKMESCLKLRKFLETSGGMDRIDAEDTVESMWSIATTGAMPSEVLHDFAEGFVFDSEAAVQTFSDLFIDMYQNTSMITNHGYKPIELAKRYR